MKKIIVAIDGFSSTGKSTMAKQLADALGYLYVDTGAMYRAVTLYAIQKAYTEKKDFKEKLIADLNRIELGFKWNPQLKKREIQLNGQGVEQEIRGMEVSDWVSEIAAIPEVREFLVKQQKAMGKAKGLVMDGRDIGTVVFPEAELKLFVTSSPEIRAQRRFEELRKKNAEVRYEEVLSNILDRDARDVSRKESPLRKAEGAIEIDNSNMTREEQFLKILKLAKNCISELSK